MLNVPHVCCARNDDSLMLSPNAGDGLHDKSSAAPSAVNTASSSENKDDSIIYKSSNSLLPKTNECGREKIENRIYSGQVSLSFSSTYFLLLSASSRWFSVALKNYLFTEQRRKKNDSESYVDKLYPMSSFSEHRTGRVRLARVVGVSER